MTVLDPTAPPVDGREAARFMGRYSRNFAAGAFATPTAKEIQALMEKGDGWHWWPSGVAAVSRRLTRDSTRKDFTGADYLLRGGHRVITHLAAEPGARLPDLDEFDWVYAYMEDRNVTQQMPLQGREVRAIRISASSEIIACWGRTGTGAPYKPVDAATLTELPLTVLRAQRDRIAGEVAAMTTWHDDFPFYSDGSWDAISLRGFNPADPTWGVKPSEMSKAWWAEHPDAAKYDRCDWTVMAEHCPATVDLVKSVSWWGQLERVRLLRMAGRGGKGGSLSRHTDVTDRAAGTRDGQIARFHIPLITHPKITMSAWNLGGFRVERHLPAWTMWYLDARKPHAVDNRAGIDRIHLVVDVVADARTRKAIAEGREHTL